MISVDAKAVVLGSQAVGKTSCVMRKVQNMFDPECNSTIGAAFFSYRLMIDDYNINIQIWDTAGQERFKSMAPMYYRRASVAILVYDITDKASFHALEIWVAELRRNVDRPVKMILFGNKSDLKDEREVDSKMAADFAESIGADNMEMSALSSKGIEEGFRRVGELVISGLANSHTHHYSSYAKSKTLDSYSSDDVDTLPREKQFPDDMKKGCGC